MMSGHYFVDDQCGELASFILSSVRIALRYNVQRTERNLVLFYSLSLSIVEREVVHSVHTAQSQQSAAPHARRPSDGEIRARASLAILN